MPTIQWGHCRLVPVRVVKEQGRLLTRIDDQEVLLLVRVNVANTGEQEASDRVFVANRGNKRTLLVELARREGTGCAVSTLCAK